MDRHVIGVAIGGTKTTIIYAKLDGFKIVSTEKKLFPTDSLNPDKTIEKIYSSIDSFPQDFDLISIICGSPLDVKNGLICSPSNLPGWKDIPIVKLLENKYKVKSTLLNDGDACALAEYHYGIGKGTNNFIYIIIGTGFGSGLILNGKLYTGSSYNAGEVGHVKVSDNGYLPRNKKIGSAEGFISGGGIGDIASLLVKDDKESSLNKYEIITAKDVFAEARNGDKLSLKIVDQAATKLGEIVSMYLDILNPDMIAIGGLYIRGIDLLEKKTLKVVKENSLPQSYNFAKIVPAILEKDIDEYSSLMGIYL